MACHGEKKVASAGKRRAKVSYTLRRTCKVTSWQLGAETDGRVAMTGLGDFVPSSAAARLSVPSTGHCDALRKGAWYERRSAPDRRLEASDD